MSSKASIVFWIGLILIFANFWLSGQSTIVWNLFVKGSSPASNVAPKGTNKGPGKIPGFNMGIPGGHHGGG